MKMKTKMAFLMAFSLIASISFAQKLDGERVTITYKQYPSHPIPERYDTYKIGCKLNDEYQNLIYDARNRFSINGFSKGNSTTKESTNFMKILVGLYRIETKNKKISSISKKMSDGNMKTHYIGEETIIIKANVEIQGYNSKGEFESFVNDDAAKSKKIKTTGNYTTKAVAEKELAKLRKRETDLLIKSFYNSDLANEITKMITFTEQMKMTKFFTVKKFKKFDYADFDEAQKIAVAAMNTLSTDITNLEGYKKAIQPAIELWNKALEESDLNAKKTRVNAKVTCTALLNIAKANFIMQDYDAALEYINKCKEIDKRFKGIDYLKMDVERNLKLKKNYIEKNKLPEYQAA